MSDKLRWGILGTGAIAKTFAKGVLASETGALTAVGSRRRETAEAFGADFLASHNLARHGSYEALLADKNVDAVYIATPHPQHAALAMAAAEAGKHILCEKPATLNYPQAMRVMDCVGRHNVFFMEAYMYRCHPLVAKLVQLLREQVIGQVRTIQANFAFEGSDNPECRTLRNDLGGGGILDVGGYCTSLIRLIAGAAMGGTIAEPSEVGGAGALGKTGVDEYAFATLKFPGNIIAAAGTGVRCSLDNTVVITGSHGSIRIPFIWIPAEKGATIVVQRKDKEAQEIKVDAPRGVYALEADVVGRAVAAGEKQAAFPAMTWADTLGNMRTLDRWRAAAQLVYEQEQPTNLKESVPGRPLAVAAKAPMIYGQVMGVGKKVSRLVFGVDKVGMSVYPMAAAMMDHYFENGGNTFDSAYIYWNGSCEKALGQWIKNNGVREQVVVLTKGAASPDCYPAALTRQLSISLERQQLDYTDIYMLHRDNPEVPIGEFVDVLNEHKRAGRVHAFGGSNWTLDRVDAFNEYAARHGLAGFSGVSNNFSLARMVDPVWEGCLSAADAVSRAWFTKRQMPLFSWSSQARGFFTDRAAPDKRDDAEMVRCWYCDDNFERQRRARAMAAKLGVHPISIALAYVLAQPFPSFPLIGPATVEEMRGSLAALAIHLTPDDLRYLNLEQ